MIQEGSKSFVFSYQLAVISLTGFAKRDIRRLRQGVMSEIATTVVPDGRGAQKCLAPC
jgi:hypothetical protein